MRRLVVVIAIGGAAILAACGGSSPEVPLGPDGNPDPVLLAGRDIYQEVCAQCHGKDGGGGRAPLLKDGQVVRRFPDVAAQIEVVENGRGAMPSFAGDLDPEQIEAVVLYTREVL